ncbi:alpha/beta hydrolase family protein [Telmatospirillum siberiense]|uniref:Dienelactone hydrolase n=1 Tax=Telmatospirillum siberiense TaxID=382514 RepID=A0A2N3PPF9_9PROT|nr:CocE/NonD family hydrolase [Telmatospirillum siberiense]PKU22291.1 dienelactone hydrolase [Telmatospirillum siberiense]
MKSPCILLLALFLGAPPAAASELIEEPLTLHATFQDLFGSETVTLDALVVRPNDERRHPLAIINHGTPRDSAERKNVFPSGMRGQAREFARRGWTAVTFTRRAFGASGGSYAEGSGVSCSSAVYEPAGRAAAEDAREVIRLMTEKPYVDGTKIISVGRSTGGFTTVALAADPPPGLVAAINFAGGRGSVRPDEVCNDSALVGAFGTFGETARIPTLWVYSENDHYFGPTLARRFYQAFTEAGGRAEFIAAPPFEADGHTLFSRAGAPIWTAYVDTFLEKQQLKLLGQPLPDEWTADARYPDGLGERGRIAFLDFLDAHGHKAFALSADGHFGWRAGVKDTQAATNQATERCRRNTAQPCRVVMIDEEAPPGQ